MLRKVRANGLTFLEYSMLIIALVAALLAMQIFMKRTLMGKWKDAADAFGFVRQY
jgi:hypothetical protein